MGGQIMYEKIAAFWMANGWFAALFHDNYPVSTPYKFQDDSQSWYLSQHKVAINHHET